MTTRPIPRTNQNKRFLLHGGPISFHCRGCGQPRYESPTDVGDRQTIVLLCAICAPRHAPLDEHAPGCDGLCADLPGSEQCFA